MNFLDWPLLRLAAAATVVQPVAMAIPATARRHSTTACMHASLSSERASTDQTIIFEAAGADLASDRSLSRAHYYYKNGVAAPFIFNDGMKCSHSNDMKQEDWHSESLAV